MATGADNPAPAASAHPDGGAVRRVAIVLTELRAGGAERVVVHLARALPRLGVRPLVVCLQHKGPLAADLEADGIAMVALESLRGYDVGAVRRLARVLKDFAPDLINVHDRASLPYVYLANWLRRRPVVFSCHGLLYQAAARPRWRERLALRDVVALTAVADETAREYSRLLGWCGPVDVIPNGVPMPPQAEGRRAAVRAELGLAQDAFVVVAVGNVKPEKAYEDLLETAALLRGAAPGRPLVVLIAGAKGDDSYAAGLDALHAKLGLGDAVRFLGFRQDADALYAAADAFVMPSRKEGLPMVLLEAMASGLPVVATRVGGMPSVLADGETGLLVPAAAPADLAAAVARLADDPALRQALGRRAREHIEHHYSVERMAARYVETFARAAAGSPGGGAASASASRPRVLMLGPLPPLVGGMATVTDNLRQSALGEWCDLVVLNNGKTTPEGRSFLQGVAAQGRLLARAVRILRHRRIQIMHIHTCQFFGFWRDVALAKVGRWLGARVLWHLHGASFDAWVAGMGRLPRWVLRRAFERSGGVIVLSQEWLDRLRPYAPAARWHAVVNGIPMPPRAADVGRQTPTFLFLGDWTKRKGVMDLVAATEAAVARGFRGQVHLAGFEKEPGQREALDRHIAESGCGAHIRVLGTLGAPEREAALRNACCLVLPSYGEGLPMAILEAMGHGVPIIATRVGAIPEVIEEGKEGSLIEPGDVQTLADRMVQLAADADLRSRMGTNARRRAQAEYGLDAMVERILAIYREILAGDAIGSTRIPRGGHNVVPHGKTPSRDP